MIDLDRPPHNRSRLWRRPRIWPAAAGIVAVLVLVVLSFQLGASTRGATTVPVTDTPGELEPVEELFNELREDAVSAPDPDALIEGAMEGMLEAVEDPYAHFYDAESYAQLNASLQGHFSGVGLVLEDREDGPVIISVLDGTPAAAAGITEGERIVEVDGKDMRDASTEQLVAEVKGEAGTDVQLTLDGGERGEYTVTITRAEIDVPMIESRLLEDGAGYVRLLQFTDDAGENVRTAATELLEQGADGIVLDLRGNPGGYLHEAVAVASVFIEDGPVVSVQEREGERETFEAAGEALDVPLVVLVDEGSASASEIVAGAVKDLDRGELVGEQTFGKGTVQTIRGLSDGLGVKFTTARYFTPSGQSIEEVGITPDRVVQGEEAQLAAAQAELHEQLADASR